MEVGLRTLLVLIAGLICYAEACDVGWIEAPHSSCYKFVRDKPLPWKDAAAACAGLGQAVHLVTIESPEEYYFIHGYRHVHRDQDQDWWTGGYFSPIGSRTGNWMWKGAYQDNEIKYTQWSGGQPDRLDNGSGIAQSCIQLFAINYQIPNGGLWDDDHCSTAKSFICEKDL